MRNAELGCVRVAHHVEVLLPPSGPEVTFLGGQELTAQKLKQHRQECSLSGLARAQLTRSRPESY